MKLKSTILFTVLIAGCAARAPKPFAAVRSEGRTVLYACPAGWRYDRGQQLGSTIGSTGKCVRDSKGSK